MNQKKCPKCGENNPAEAVMCWACYTPLSGGATVAAGAGGAAAMAAPGTAVAGKDEGEKKPIAPWQIGVVVGALLLAVGFGIYTFMGSSSDDPSSVSVNVTDANPNYGPGPGGYPNNSPVVSGPAPDSGPGGGPTIDPKPIPYALIASPNVTMSWGVMAIVPNRAGTSPVAAASLAKFARNQFSGVTSWEGMHIYVFSDTQSAQAFNDYQAPRRHALLGPGEYGEVANLWPKCLARYEYRRNGREKVVYPSRNPGAWWR